MRRRFEQHGAAGLFDRRSGGRRQRIPADIKPAVLELVRLRYLGCSCAAIQRVLAAQHGITVGAETLRRWLTAAGMIGPHALDAVERADARTPNPAPVPAHKLPFRYRARRLRQWLSEVQVPQHTGPSPALIAALKDVARSTDALVVQAELEFAAHDFIAAYKKAAPSMEALMRHLAGNEKSRRYHS